MTNSRLVLDSAKPIAAKIAASLKSHAIERRRRRVHRQRVFGTAGHPPDAAELHASEQALAQWRKLPKTTAEDARSYLVWSLLNDNDFVTLR